ncbi:uncharacterized protein LTR77_002924 [Saxophila tyrrhenica]|uniref:Peptidase S54 rhomboid domain-containing protein n=1 Tax=Saxophila tyrrhenica TaxID=1690608 RepID=A0AAV9PIR6_9PEZI|nr:hypothetical protein LTR77_002924 [Saxophila tyrrhenica]
MQRTVRLQRAVQNSTRYSRIGYATRRPTMDLYQWRDTPLFSRFGGMIDKSTGRQVYFGDTMYRTLSTATRFTADKSQRSATGAIWAIIGLNTLVFGAWQYAKATQDAGLVQKLQENFTISLQGWRQGRVWTALTSAFSHNWLPHFFFNMFAFYSFGSALAFIPGIGAAHIVPLCVGSALVGSASFLYDAYQRSPPQKQGGRMSSYMPVETYRSGLGASGMVMGVGATAACLMPFLPTNIMFIPIAIPLWATTLLFVGVDTYFLHSNSPVGHSAHLGGAIFGAMYYFAYLRRFGGAIWVADMENEKACVKMIETGQDCSSSKLWSPRGISKNPERLRTFLLTSLIFCHMHFSHELSHGLTALFTTSVSRSCARALSLKLRGLHTSTISFLPTQLNQGWHNDTTPAVSPHQSYIITTSTAVRTLTTELLQIHDGDYRGGEQYVVSTASGHESASFIANSSQANYSHDQHSEQQTPWVAA